MIDKEKVEAGVRLILEGIGEDVNREGLLETPDRIARMYEEIFGGMDMDAAEPLKKRFHASNNEMVVEKDITFYSTCCLLYTSPSPRDGLLSRMPSSA